MISEFCSKKINDSCLIESEVLEDRIVLICPKDSKFSKKDIVEPEEINGLENVFFMEKDCGTIEAVKKFLARNKIAVNVAGDFSNSEILKNFVKKGSWFRFYCRKCNKKRD